jgi:uncharacterized protein YkwD
MRYRFILLLAVAMVALLTVAAPAAEASTPKWDLLTAINKTRRAHGLKRVFIDPSLRTVAQRHTNDMLWRSYFAHTSPTGSTLYTRVANSSFLRWGQWWAGETLAWGTGSYATPQATLRAWLRSPAHRAVLLSSRYNWIGIGRTVGKFEGHSGAVLWTADFGHR